MSYMDLHVGTSGFAYKEWKGKFYPVDLPAPRMLTYYAGVFPAVEINSTFFRMPAETTLEQWAALVPDDFTFSLKAPQQITHRKRLKDVAEPVARFFEAARVLKDRLGPALVQLPPNMKKDLPRLEAFLDLLPQGTRVAVEFRHPSWFEDDVMDALRVHGVALCIAHGEETPTPPVATTDWGYLRLRQVDYEEGELAEWVDVVRQNDWTEAFVFFKHEDRGTGPLHAQRFREIFEL